MYRRVTAEVKRRIEAGEFDDGPRMERFDVLFARRYLDAWAQHERGEVPTGVWALAFAAGERWRPVVLQHLLLGMNAHINLDLGIVAAVVGHRVGQAGIDHVAGFVAHTVDLKECLDGQLAGQLPLLDLLLVVNLQLVNLSLLASVVRCCSHYTLSSAGQGRRVPG